MTSHAAVTARGLGLPCIVGANALKIDLKKKCIVTKSGQTFNECDPKHPMPIMQIHGAKDNTVPYEGSGTMKPIDDVMEYWVNYNACNLTPSQTTIDDNDEDGFGGTRSVYNGCMNDVSVELYYLDGLGHQWPSIKGTRVFDIDSASVIWEFFSKYNVDGLVE